MLLSFLTHNFILFKNGFAFFRIIYNWFLTVASFLDPRFQSQTKQSELNQIKLELEEFCADQDLSTNNKKVDLLLLKNETTEHKKIG